jgi:hypothetical protein
MSSVNEINYAKDCTIDYKKCDFVFGDASVRISSFRKGSAKSVKL